MSKDENGCSNLSTRSMSKDNKDCNSEEAKVKKLTHAELRWELMQCENWMRRCPPQNNISDKQARKLGCDKAMRWCNNYVAKEFFMRQWNAPVEVPDTPSG